MVELLDESLLVGLSIAATLTVACVVLRVQRVRTEQWLERTLPAVACVVTPGDNFDPVQNPKPFYKKLLSQR